MSESLTDTGASPFGEVTLPRVALKALGELPGIACGALSPLARLQAPREPARRDLLISALEPLRGDWEWSVPALIDPRLSVALLLGDGETSLLGQYVWPDAEARGPGFKAYLEGLNLKMSGPVTLEEVQQTLLDFLALSSVGEMEPVRLSLLPEELWTLAALGDAYRSAVLRRRLAREGGRPVGVGCREVMSAWEIGIGSPNPGWAVSLFTLLVPDRVPQGFQNRIPQVLTSMARADLLEPLSGNGGDPLAESYMFGEGIDLLLRPLAGPVISFGLAVQRQREGLVEVTVLGGWRTSGGISVADLSQMENGRIDMLLAGPHFLVELVEASVAAPAGEEMSTAFSLETPYGRSEILAGLQSLGTGAPAGPTVAFGPAASRPAPSTTAATSAEAVCPSCGTALKPGARFCPACGKPAETAQQATVAICPQCSARNAPGTRFCRECGNRLA